MGVDSRLQDHVRSNALKSALLVVGFPFVLPLVSFGVVLLLAAAVGQRDPISAGWTAFVAVFATVGLATIIWLPIGYVLSQSIIDAATGARLVERSEERRLWTIYENLCRKCGMRLPALRIIETDALNAFASGLREGQYSVTVTRGLLNALDDAELEAVLAHELTHIRNHDCRLLVVATILVGLVPMLHDFVVRAFWFVVMGFLNIYRAIFSLIPIGFVQLLVTGSYTAMFWAGKGVAYVIGVIGNFCSLIIHFALSRRREFMADAGAVEMTGNPDAMISALRKVSCNSALPVKIDGVREMLFESSHLQSLFATHPPIEERIAAINAYAEGFRQGARASSDRIVQSPMSVEVTAQPPPPPMSPPPAPPPEPSVADGYYDALMRAMGGRPEMLAGERREAVYRSARHALIDQVCRIDPPPSEDEASNWEAGLEEAIGRIETRLIAERRDHKPLRAQR